MTPKRMAPERIYDWMNSQLSIARHYGGIRYMGYDYVIDYTAERQPLVRSDLMTMDELAKSEKKKWKKEETADMFGGGNDA